MALLVDGVQHARGGQYERPTHNRVPLGIDQNIGRRYAPIELLKQRPTPGSVGMGSYGIDSHNIQRYITPEGYVQNEGDIGVSTNGPYQIAYGSIVPRKGQADNLIVPVCVSSSHIAFGSIRMEPVFMILGQSAATAAALALDGKMAVQDVPYSKLRERLLKDKQILEYSSASER